MSELSRPPAYVNWPRLTLLVIGFISVLYGALHFVAHETVGTPNVVWSAFIGLLAGLGIGIPILIKQRRVARDGTDQHLGDPAVRSAAGWIGVVAGLGLALVSSLYSDFGWFQLDPPPEPIVRLFESRITYLDPEGQGAEGETAQGVRMRYVCPGRASCRWERVSQSIVAAAADENRCAATVALPFAGLLPFAPGPVVSGYSGETCRGNRGARFVLVATSEGRVWLWRSDQGMLAGEGVQPFLRALEAFNGLLAGLFAGLLLYCLKGSRYLPVDRWTSLTRVREPSRLPSWRFFGRHPFMRLARLASIVFGAPGIVLLLVLTPGFPNGAAEVLKSILIAGLFGGVVAILALVVLRIAMEVIPGSEKVSSSLVFICALLGLWVGVLAAFASSEIPITGWSKLEPSPEPLVKFWADSDPVRGPDDVCGVTREEVRYARVCEGGVCSWIPQEAGSASRGARVRCGETNYFYQFGRRPLLPLPPGPVVFERIGRFIGGEHGRQTFFVILADDSVWWSQRESSLLDPIRWGISVVWGLITGIIVGIAVARMRRTIVGNVDNVGKVGNVIDLIKPDPPDQT